MISAIGARETYQVFSAVTFITGVAYFLFNHFYLRQRATEGNEICKKEPKKPKPAPIEHNMVETNEKLNGDLKSVQFTKETESKKNNKEKLNATENLGFEKDEHEDLEKNEKIVNNGAVNLGFKDDDNKEKNNENKVHQYKTGPQIVA